MEEAIEKFFPDHKKWDLPSFRKAQSESIQIIADGQRMETSLIIYDDGEGQHPEDFERTFLSLLRGNKNEIHFVQGKYNMGGSGAIVFCGKKRYHLIASKRYDGKGKFGFTLIRQHPFTKEEEEKKKNTWYEYFKINGQIPSFEIDQLDLGLYNRKFTTGTILKLYSYDLPPGSRSVISRDLNQSINEFLFEPALPVYTIDKKERYPDDRNLERDLYGLKRRLEEEKSKYVDDYFLESYKDKEIGELKITCYVFKPRIEGKTAKESRESIQREFFKNNMSVLFSLNGQVHGHFTSEFISRTLKMQLIKDYILIHVDCTNLHYAFRKELFMASRDRLKQGEETSRLREIVAKVLLKSKLVDIYKKRKDTISFAGEDKNELIKSFTKNLPLKSELLKLLNQTFKLEEKGEKPDKEKKEKKRKEKEEEFKPERFPTYFKYGKNGKDEKPMIKIPLGGEKVIKFKTDVENEYFVRVEEPGELKITLLKHTNNETEGGTKPGTPKEIDDLFYVQKSNPQDGTIKIVLAPTDEVKVGDTVEIKATLTSPGKDFDQIFLVKIVEKEKPKEKIKQTKDEEENKIGLPDLILVYKEPKEGEERKTWADLEGTPLEMGYETVVQPFAEGDILQAIYVNMDSNVLKNYKTTLKSAEQYEAAEKRYYTSVYFHTLFLFTISKNKKYSMKRDEGEQVKDVDLVEYVKDIFESYYAQFLLNFGMSELVQSLE
ncbi:hypothetical protein MROS_1113 [Melioribacter roseus P3M-2]|uniref:Uncharacterized protein n=2 Tax=Melioribacter roseus TaxID=1134405 RepID=I6YUV8_MELRP|nr:hypothetical protein MROS_1113 [Melioribacter roseus P3M-2]